MAFIGRKKELKQLISFNQRKQAGLVVMRGRRRIGKSTLIKEFGKSQPKAHYVEFQGLAPRKDIGKQDQLDNFAEQLGVAYQLPGFRFNNWNEAFDALARLSSKEQTIILLDEISWMAHGAKDFAGKLKIAWDTRFKSNDKLRLVLCGSVTTWIEENILNDKGFMGRVSLTMTLKELALFEANEFWPKHYHVSTTEKIKTLCVTGGVPRYLEEWQMQLPFEENIKRLFFTPEGLLFSEFDKILIDIFGKNAPAYREIMIALTDGAKTNKELLDKLKISSSGGFSKKLKNLVLCGFISRDYVSGGANIRNLSRYRLKDNYMRFYLKYVEPKKQLIEQQLYSDIPIETLPGWDSIMGLQFENLVLNNIPLLVKHLNINPASIISASPYFQRKTQRQQACQIDLLIKTKKSCYVLEMKLRDSINSSVINEVAEKIKRLKLPGNLSIRPILICHGTIASNVIEADYFSRIVEIEALLTNIV